MTQLEIVKRNSSLKTRWDKFRKLHKKRQLNPENMPGDKLITEYNLLWSLVGTIYMTTKMFERWRIVEREYSVRAAGCSQI